MLTGNQNKGQRKVTASRMAGLPKILPMNVVVSRCSRGRAGLWRRLSAQSSRCRAVCLLGPAWKSGVACKSLHVFLSIFLKLRTVRTTLPLSGSVVSAGWETGGDTHGCLAAASRAPAMPHSSSFSSSAQMHAAR